MSELRFSNVVLPISDTTIMFWINSFNVISGTVRLMYASSGFSTPADFNVRTDNSVITVGDESGGSVSSTSTTLNLDDGQWHHIAVVLSYPGFADFYKDGVLISSNFGTPTSPSSTDIAIGESYKFDEFDFRYYNTRMLATDISYYYNDVVSNNGENVLPIL